MSTVTISRLPGAWGDALGEHLAQSLNYRLMDRPALLDAVRQLGVEAVAAASPELSERSPSLFERLSQDRHRYLAALRRAMIEAVEKGNVVIVGLGGGQLLKDLPQVVRIQVVAPLDVRIERLMAEGPRIRPGRLSQDEAREVLHRLDHDRAGFMRFMFHIDWLDPAHWEIVLNTGSIALADSVAILATAARRVDAQVSEAGRAKLSNLSLASRVEWRLLNEPNVGISDLRVRAQDGAVMIEGHVVGAEEVEIAGQAAAAVDGVRSLANYLQLQPFPYGPI